VRQVLADRGIDTREVRELLGSRLGNRALGSAGRRHPQLDLAALESRRQQRAQRWLEAAELVGKAQRDVEKAAVDRADLDRRRGLGAAAFRPLCGCFVQCCRTRGGSACRGIRVAGHAVD